MKCPRWFVTLVAVMTLVAAPALTSLPAAAQTGDQLSVADGVDVAFTSPADWAPAAPGATARAYVLVDADTGQELAVRNADERIPVASTVKMLTVLTALDAVSLDDEVVVGDEVLVGEASVGLRPGDRWTVRQLVEAIIVRSGNDAALALAAHAGGDVETFVGSMRAKAAELGLDGAVIETPTGLDDANLLSARDLAIIGQALLAIPEVAVIADLEQVTLPGLGTVRTRNILLDQRPEVTGLKTGHTNAAGWCLVASMQTDDGRELLAVILGAAQDEDRFAEALALLDFGDDDFAPELVTTGARLRAAGGWVDAQAGTTVSVPGASAATVAANVKLDRLTQEVIVDGALVATLGSNLARPSRSGGSVGARLVDRLYDAMRAVHAADGWSPDFPEG